MLYRLFCSNSFFVVGKHVLIFVIFTSIKWNMFPYIHTKYTLISAHLQKTSANSLASTISKTYKWIRWFFFYLFVDEMKNLIVTSYTQFERGSSWKYKKIIRLYLLSILYFECTSIMYRTWVFHVNWFYCQFDHLHSQFTRSLC